jgi:hypothetical protein
MDHQAKHGRHRDDEYGYDDIEKHVSTPSVATIAEIRGWQFNAISESAGPVNFFCIW